MKIETRGYQVRTCESVHSLWRDGANSVLVVAPPGSGKTEISFMVMSAFQRAPRVLIVVHTRSLATQWEKRLAAAFGEEVNVIMEGRHSNPQLRLHVAVVHSLIKGIALENVDLVILDEAHHYLAKEWGIAQYTVKGKKPLLLGLTATPERDDGQPLGDIFQQLVVAAKYSELIEGGWIVPARVIAPNHYLKTNYAQHPVDAWAAHSGGVATLAFFPLIQVAEMYSKEFLARGVASMVSHSEQPSDERDVTWEAFGLGKCTVVASVAAAIEGINVPHCGCAILGRSFEFIGGYLQATGRALRAHPGKEVGIIIDLTGASVAHGLPDQDFDYSLEGKAISAQGASGGRLGSTPERSEPSVLDLQMFTRSRGAIVQSTPIPAPLELPEADHRRVERDAEIKKSLRKLRTKYGKDIAERFRRDVEALKQ